jgi:signal peptidase II
MKNRIKYIIITLSIFGLNFALDRITKYYAVIHLQNGEVMSFFNNCFILIFAENEGAFLSLGADWNIYIKYCVLLFIPILICAAGLLYLMFKEEALYRIITLSCVAGGGIGNLIDRLFNDFSVVDFMNFGIGNIRTGILNVADLSVTFGVLALALIEFSPKRSLERQKND